MELEEEHTKLQARLGAIRADLAVATPEQKVQLTIKLLAVTKELVALVAAKRKQLRGGRD